MSYIFRLHTNGPATYEGWNESPSFPYDSQARETIADPNGGDARHAITSIPSPFARVDLVKNAFKEVCSQARHNLQSLEGTSVFHKMVSDALDVGEIFFNIDKLKGKVEIIAWDVEKEIKALEESNEQHQNVANSLRKYLLSDAKTYHFDKLKSIYLLNYVQGPAPLNIIGATSPATLFFSTANDLSYIKDVFFANNDKPFDADLQPLYKRDADFIKALWTIRASFSGFSTLFPEVEDYLMLTYKAITSNDLKQELNAIGQEDVDKFSWIDVASNQQMNQVEVLGTKLLKKKKATVSESSFAIKTGKSIGNATPLVLPVDSGNTYAVLEYVNGAWGKDNKAPYKNDTEPEMRELPFDGTPYPYLTLNDFLEETMVRVPHALNKKHFFNGNLTGGEEAESFLVPIKPLFLKYFSVDDLKGDMADGKKTFEMERLAGGSVAVTLRIPIKGKGTVSYIEYRRTYYANREAEVSETKNDGSIKDFDFTGLVMPYVKFQNEQDAYYTVAKISTFSRKYALSFYNGGEVLRDIPIDCRHKDKTAYDYKAETYTIEHHNFDAIRISDGMVDNLLIPVFFTHNDADSFEFAVDLGTSNTHIECKKATDVQSSPLQFGTSEAPFATFFVPTYVYADGKQRAKDLLDEDNLTQIDYLPAEISTASDYKFPTRTALSCAKAIDWKAQLRSFGFYNLSFTYNKQIPLSYNNVPIVDIKWSKEGNARAAMQAYIDNIMLLIRNKVVLNNGNIRQTKVNWFYPNSMSPKRRSQLKEAWDESYKKFFNQDGDTMSVSESVAPIRYYFTRYATATNLVNIDIGGGTTDIAFSSSGKVDYITSFRFAGNSLFADTFSPLNVNNGIIDYFKDYFRSLLGNDGVHNDLRVVFEQNAGKPAEMASFLFSLKNNSYTKNLNQRDIDFNKVLEDDEKFKIIFILFYTSIIYHIAKIIKVKKLKLPRHISFSGNGSKIISIVSSDKNILSDYTKKVIEKVVGCKCETDLDVLGLEGKNNPKESTCKGGLLPSDGSMSSSENILLKDSRGNLAEDNFTYSTITDKDKADIIDSVKEFFSFALVEMPKAIKFDDCFGVEKDSIDIALKECCKDLDTYLEKGLNMLGDEAGDSESQISETLSFYPIKGALQAISTKLYEHYRQNKER